MPDPEPYGYLPKKSSIIMLAVAPIEIAILFLAWWLILKNVIFGIMALGLFKIPAALLLVAYVVGTFALASRPTKRSHDLSSTGEKKQK